MADNSNGNSNNGGRVDVPELTYQWQGSRGDWRRLVWSSTLADLRHPVIVWTAAVLAVLGFFLTPLIELDWTWAFVVAALVVALYFAVVVTLLSLSRYSDLRRKFSEDAIVRTGFDARAIRIRSRSADVVVRYSTIKSVTVVGSAVCLAIRPASPTVVLPAALVPPEQIAAIRAGITAGPVHNGPQHASDDVAQGVVRYQWHADGAAESRYRRMMLWVAFTNWRMWATWLVLGGVAAAAEYFAIGVVGLLALPVVVIILATVTTVRIWRSTRAVAAEGMWMYSEFAEDFIVEDATGRVRMPYLQVTRIDDHGDWVVLRDSRLRRVLPAVLIPEAERRRFANAVPSASG